MTDDLRRAFADITAHLETLHGISVEGQHRDNTPDMQRVLASHLLSGLAGISAEVRSMSARIEQRGS
jgi:hypothetical protein